MSDSIAVVYLARSETGVSDDFLTFAKSYRQFTAGFPHTLIIIRKGAATTPHAKMAIAQLFDGIPFIGIDVDDIGYDIQAYLKVSRMIPHKYVCFLNTYAEICADDWLGKLMQPLLRSARTGMVGVTGSYESLNSSYGLYCKIIWMCSNKLIGYDPRIAKEFVRELTLHVPEWLAMGQSQDEVSGHMMDLPELQRQDILEGFEAHWRDATRYGGPLFSLNQYKPFPNPHLRSNGFVINRAILNSLNFDLDNSKLDCVRFESGLDGLPTRLAQLGLNSVLVGADGMSFETERWSESNTFRLGLQSNILIKDNQTRAYDDAPVNVKEHLSRLSWGAYANNNVDLFEKLGFPHNQGILKLSHAFQPRQHIKNRPLLISIVIPTRNRLSLVKDAIYSVIHQGYPHWECVVFDNNSEESFEQDIAAFNDSRIRYIRSETFLPVTDSWNRAIDAATGDYITLLGDDDGLTPDFMSCIEFIVKQHQNPDFVYTSLFQFFHPGVAPWKPEGYVIDLRYGLFFEGRDDICKIDPRHAQQAVVGSLDFRRNFAFNMQSFCFSKSFLNSLRFDGKVFHSPFPDYYLANVAMALGKVITISPKPISIAGVSKKSFGFTLFNSMENQGAALLGTDLLADPIYKIYESTVLPGPAYNTNFLITMLHVEKRLGDFAPEKVNLERYRRLQILRNLFQNSETVATALSDEFKSKLYAQEIHWAECLMNLSSKVQQGDPNAANELQQIHADTAMHGKPATVNELDVGSFAILPELFDAMKRGAIRHA